MDTRISYAICCLHLDDIVVERWFELVCETYGQLADADKGDWQRFVVALNDGALSAGVDRFLVEQFAEHMAANDVAPLETVGEMTMAPHELPWHYRQLAADQAAVEDTQGPVEESAVDVNSFPDTRIGDSGDWVRYLDTMLTHHGY
jgi:hypothetical protein